MYLIRNEITVSTMESCTSGQIASLLTNTEGASAIFPGGFVTYCNEAKEAAGVSGEILRSFGVYSAETARAMAYACRDRMHTRLGIGVTGSFGNADPNNADSVPGRVYYAVSFDDRILEEKLDLPFFKERLEYKYHVADRIATQLFKMLKL